MDTSIFDTYKSNDKKYTSPLNEFIKTYCNHCDHSDHCDHCNNCDHCDHSNDCSALPNPIVGPNCAFFDLCHQLVRLEALKKIEGHLQTLLSQQQIPWQAYLSSQFQPLHHRDEGSP
ncbi:MAG: hypothetical protein LBH74_08220 [Nitrososphaerota archaeon]|nr:hypothetical protein [Nitrososphaerota archaeon]